MDYLQLVQDMLVQHLEAKPLAEDQQSWMKCLKSIPYDKYVPLSYKPSFIEYQKAYFSDIYDDYRDISVVLYRGGIPIGIWPLCLYRRDGYLHFGSLGGYLLEPYFVFLVKAEAQRHIIQRIIEFLSTVVNGNKDFCKDIHSQITIMGEGSSQWQRKWMEQGAICLKVSWWAFADLSLDWNEIQLKIRRTNKYSVEKGRADFDTEIYDSDTEELSKVFEEFHKMHRTVSGRETRSQMTWDIQKESIQQNSICGGNDFVIFIRDKISKELAGSALFAATPQTGLYCVAAYDRERFSRPVGHIIQAVAMNYMKNNGVRWYEIGERVYPNDEGSTQKLVNIGNYKEGFATHIFPKIVMQLKL